MLLGSPKLRLIWHFSPAPTILLPPSPLLVSPGNISLLTHLCMNHHFRICFWESLTYGVDFFENLIKVMHPVPRKTHLHTFKMLSIPFCSHGLKMKNYRQNDLWGPSRANFAMFPALGGFEEFSFEFLNWGFGAPGWLGWKSVQLSISRL